MFKLNLTLFFEINELTNNAAPNPAPLSSGKGGTKIFLKLLFSILYHLQHNLMLFLQLKQILRFIFFINTFNKFK